MDINIINSFNKQYLPEGGSWNKDSCLTNNLIETHSGPGSLLRNTDNLIINLEKFIKENNIKTIIDAPCGDFNYMKEINLDNTFYKGYDISELAIELCKKYEKDNIKFNVFDITFQKLDYADLIICKDLFIHLSFNDINKILKNIIDSKCKFFAVSRYDNGKITNIDKETGLSARAIEITLPPFNFNYKIIQTIKYSTNKNLQDEMIIFKMN